MTCCCAHDMLQPLQTALGFMLRLLPSEFCFSSEIEGRQGCGGGNTGEENNSSPKHQLILQDSQIECLDEGANVSMRHVQSRSARYKQVYKLEPLFATGKLSAQLLQNSWQTATVFICWCHPVPRLSVCSCLRSSACRSPCILVVREPPKQK